MGPRSTSVKEKASVVRKRAWQSEGSNLGELMFMSVASAGQRRRMIAPDWGRLAEDGLRVADAARRGAAIVCGKFVDYLMCPLTTICSGFC